LFELLDKIKRRLVNDYQMQLAIAQNPHISDDDERRALWDTLHHMLEEEETLEPEPQLDISGFQVLKLNMTGNPRIVIK
jgi:hypothetical protein